MSHALLRLGLAAQAEDRFPLQQFYLLPHKWTYLVHRRALTPAPGPRSWSARFHHVWWFLTIDVGLHLALKLLVSGLRSRYMTRAFYRHVVPRLVATDRIGTNSASADSRRPAAVDRIDRVSSVTGCTASR